jgi:hypothetical protein
MKTASRSVSLVTLAVLGFALVPLMAQQHSPGEPVATPATVPVTVKNFQRAESDTYFANSVKRGGFGKLYHYRTPTPIDQQEVIRMNRDTLYSSGVFDLDAGPVTIALPDPGKRFMSLLVIDEDHYNPPVVYAPGTYTFSRGMVGTRYMFLAIRTLANPGEPADVKAANELQDRIVVKQPGGPGKFAVPSWDPVSQKKIRDALLVLASASGSGPTERRFGAKGEVDPIQHLMATAAGWGGNPAEAAVYVPVYVAANDGTTVHKLTVKDVPVDGFWSISVYNAQGYFEKNALDSYSLNNLTTRPNADGSHTVQFGGCAKDTTNCLFTPAGWNYVVRLYRPRKEILQGTWNFPEAQPTK